MEFSKYGISCTKSAGETPLMWICQTSVCLCTCIEGLRQALFSSFIPSLKQYVVYSLKEEKLSCDVRAAPTTTAVTRNDATLSCDAIRRLLDVVHAFKVHAHVLAFVRILLSKKSFNDTGNKHTCRNAVCIRFFLELYTSVSVPCNKMCGFLGHLLPLVTYPW